MPTASAVTADIIDTAVGRTRLTFETLEYFSADNPPRVKLRDADTLTDRFYFRLPVSNHPGTLAAITGVLSQHGISIASVIQHESDADDAKDTPVQLVIMTHEASEGSARKATQTIESLDSVAGNVVRYRVKR
jgi:homoserine dehydrogenase